MMRQAKGNHEGKSGDGRSNGRWKKAKEKAVVGTERGDKGGVGHTGRRRRKRKKGEEKLAVR